MAPQVELHEQHDSRNCAIVPMQLHGAADEKAMHCTKKAFFERLQHKFNPNEMNGLCGNHCSGNSTAM